MGPRDGLQFEDSLVATTNKVELINKLTNAKMPIIECTSFIHPKYSPQFSDSGLIGSQIAKESTSKYLAFSPHRQGVKMASDYKYDGISFSVTACEKTLQKTLNTDSKTFLKTVKEIVDDANSLNLFTRCYLSFCMGSEHYEDIDPKKVNEVANSLHDMGVKEIVLQDNISRGTIEKLDKLLETITVPKEKLAGHFHDSKANGMDLVIYAMSKGISIIDCAVAGLGQCPFNESAFGNMVSEEIIFVLDIMGIEHGVEWKPLLDADDFISETMTRESRTEVYDVDFDEELDRIKIKYSELIKSLR